jgi:hypothetical protein
MGYGSRNTPAQEPVPPADLMPDDPDYLPRAAQPDAQAPLPPVVPVDESQEPAAEPQTQQQAAPADAGPQVEPATQPPPDSTAANPQ